MFFKREKPESTADLLEGTIANSPRHLRLFRLVLSNIARCKVLCHYTAGWRNCDADRKKKSPQ